LEAVGCLVKVPVGGLGVCRQETLHAVGRAGRPGQRRGWEARVQQGAAKQRARSRRLGGAARACEVYALPRHQSASWRFESMPSACWNLAMACTGEGCVLVHVHDAGGRTPATPTPAPRSHSSGPHLLDHVVGVVALAEVRQLEERTTPLCESLRVRAANLGISRASAGALTHRHARGAMSAPAHPCCWP
jgi:hypothetical protein